MATPVSYLAHIRDLALTGTIRGPAMFANLTAAAMGGELALRGAEWFIGFFSYESEKMSNNISKMTPDFVKTAASYLGFDRAVQSIRPFAEKTAVKKADGSYKTDNKGNIQYVPTKWTNRNLALTAIATIIWSSLAVEAVEFLAGKPHWGYNAVLSPISVFRVADTTPVKYIWNAAKTHGLV